MNAPKITAYDIHIEVSYSGENTYAEGWIELDGECSDFRAEADVSNRGTTIPSERSNLGGTRFRGSTRGLKNGGSKLRRTPATTSTTKSTSPHT